eukprot:TRINITY_DN2282_c0_g1_i1.p1 TRINITY_DN2282_c0_g1~~TRINITY_DN2282_c0_g1_i1.p1  ORF type:complete len:327 (+),score=74.05 TRINITY_DN2282_c0_g1_i1:117-1097(+)
MDPKGLGGGLPTRNKDLTGVANDTDVDDMAKKLQLDDPDQFLANQPENVQKRVEALKELWNKYQEHHNSFLEEVKALQIKYQSLYDPLLKERSQIVSGDKKVDGAEEGDGGIPNFWLNALTKSFVVGQIVQERDLPLLAYLTNISVRMLEEKDENGFELLFEFGENSYFDNKELVKTYYMADLECTILKMAKGTKIDWKDGKDITKKMMRRKVKPGQVVTGPLTKVVQADSFFNFFDPPPIPEDAESVAVEHLQEIQLTLEADYEVGATIREKIVPMAVLYYTGEARQLEEEEGLDEEFEDDDDDDDDDDEDGEGGAKEGQDCKQQ